MSTSTGFGVPMTQRLAIADDRPQHDSHMILAWGLLKLGLCETEHRGAVAEMISEQMKMDRPVSRRRTVTPKRLGLLLGLAGCGVGVVLLFPSIDRWFQSEVSVDADRVRLAKVTRGALIREIAVQGRVVAAFHPTVFSPSAGIVAVDVRAGAVVEKGAVLCRVTSPKINNRLDQELSRLHSLEAELSRQRIQAKQVPLRNQQRIDLLGVELQAAKRAQERAEKSRALGILTEVEYEKTQDQAEILSRKLEFAKRNSVLERESLAFEIEERKSQLERQRLAVADWQRQVDGLTIRSPVTGLVSRLHVEDREAVGENARLVTVVDLSAFEIEIAVAEDYADEIAPGTGAVLTINQQQFAGQVRSISPEVQGSQVKGVVAFTDRTPDGLKQHQRVTTRLMLDRRADVLKVRRGPFLESGGGRRAYVVKDGLASARPIEVGLRSVTEVEILSGLQPGETIIVSDTARFNGAQKVLLRR